MSARQATVERQTRETQIKLTFGLDGSGKSAIATGVGFLDHMLELLAKHGCFDITVEATGDTQVDDHHTVEDVGICLGQALSQALGTKAGIRRFGFASLPMQDSLANVTVDLGGRYFLAFNAEFPSPKIGTLDSELVQEFMEAFASNAAMNLHINVPYGTNAHHVAEAIFKGLARSLRAAVEADPRMEGLPTSKGLM